MKRERGTDGFAYPLPAMTKADKKGVQTVEAVKGRGDGGKE